MKLCIFGDIFGGTGYSSHTKQLANAIYDQLGPDDKMRIKTSLPVKWQSMVNDNEIKMIDEPYTTDMTAIFIGQPQFNNIILSKNPKHFVQFVVWEGDIIPAFWEKHLDNPKVDEIWVPSEHVKIAIINRCPQVKDKIFIVPHGVDFKLFPPKIKTKNDRLVFFYNKGWSKGINDRGGVQWAIKAFREEFSGDDNVELRIKINPYYNMGNWNIKDELHKLGIPKEDNPAKIYICNNDVALPDLHNYYHEADVFLAPTMSEGFGLTMAEAMSCGLPVITTNFGGQTDFVNNENGWLIDYDLIDVTWDLSYEGVKWAKPNMKQLKEVMREAYNNRDTIVLKGEKALKDIMYWSWESSAKKAIEALNKLKE